MKASFGQHRRRRCSSTPIISFSLGVRSTATPAHPTSIPLP